MVFASRYKDDHSTASRLAEKLRNTPEGIDAAIADLSVSGGRSQGLGAWMLTTSALGTNVEPKLKQIASSSIEPLNRRVEAVWIMWLRTSDLNYLEELFVLVRQPGDTATGYGRRYLQKCFIPGAEYIRSKLDVSEHQPLSLTREEFKRLVREPGVIFHESNALQ